MHSPLVTSAEGPLMRSRLRSRPAGPAQVRVRDGWPAVMGKCVAGWLSGCVRTGAELQPLRQHHNTCPSTPPPGSRRLELEIIHEAHARSARRDRASITSVWLGAGLLTIVQGMAWLAVQWGCSREAGWIGEGAGMAASGLFPSYPLLVQKDAA